MGKQRQFLLDGMSVKNVNPWDTDNTQGWTLIGGEREPQGVSLLASRVPWLYRGVKDRANNVNVVPWCIERGETEIASSATWSEKKPRDLEWLDNPRRLLGQIEKSLAIAGKAYIRLAINPSGYIKRSAYCAPQTIEEQYDKDTGELTGYKRNANGKSVDCTRADRDPVAGQEQIVAIYDPDYATEVGPGTWSDALAAMSAAGVLYKYDQFVGDFFGRGAVVATILSVEDATQGERERLQHWWDDLVKFGKNFAAYVFGGRGVQPVKIGEGMGDVNNTDLVTTRRQDISTALGVPESRLWSSAANYATRKEDELAYFRGTIVPDCDLIAEAFNSQVFTAAHKLDGLRMEFTPENLDVFQEDEADRADSLTKLTAASVPLVMAMEILGYDLTEEQWAELRKREEDKRERAEQITNTPAPQPAPQPKQMQDEPPAPDEEPQAAPMTPDRAASIRAMLKNWKRKSVHVLKMTGRACIPWETELLPAETVAEINEKLSACETETQVKAVFDGVEIGEAENVTGVEVVTKGDDLSTLSALITRLEALA